MTLIPLIILMPAIVYIIIGLLFCILMYVLLFRWLTLSRRRLEAERQQINEAKLRFFTSISHDLRTPLSMIITPLEKIINEQSGSPVAEQLREVAGNARFLMDEIDQILDFKQLSTKASEYHPAYGDLAGFTGEVCNAYASLIGAEKGILTVDPGTEPLMTSFDRDMMRRILHNLIGNAFKNSIQDTAVSVHVTVGKEDEAAVIRISDNGRGLSPKTKEHIFEPFYIGEDDDYPGNGLGMNIVKEFVSKHGGRITVSDNLPSGTVFTITIPVKSDTEPSSELSGTLRNTERTGKPFILNVEDNPAFRYFVTENLSGKYDIVEASGAKEALKLLEDNNFDLILTDLVMPGMDGRELCRAIRSDIRYANTPIIMLTTVQGEEAGLENLKAGADDSLEKPFNIESLVIRIERLLNRKRPLLTDTDISGHRISRQDREFLDRVKAEIEENLQESEYTIESLCSSMGVSRSGLYKKMMQLTGKSPIEFIRILRLEKGREMLENGETSVSQIAWSVGFSPKQFSKHFKDEYGCLPSEYIHSLTD